MNRRSAAPILEAANRVAAPLHAAIAGALPLEPGDPTAAGAVRLAVHETAADELTFVAASVAQAHASGTSWADIAVLARDNRAISDLHDTLVRHGVPVQVVGLSGLLRAPEVVEVVSTLQVVADMTANPAVLGLLSGPRWAIGVADLALLGRRARLLARGEVDEDQPVAPVGSDVHASLGEAVAGTDPMELVSLAEALEDPGPMPYSRDARARFRALARELRELRAMRRSRCSTWSVG